MAAFLSWILYLILGLFLISWIFPNTQGRKDRFLLSYILASIFVIAYHHIGIMYEYSSWFERGFTPPAGIFTIDGLQYHENGMALANHRFSMQQMPHQIGWTIAWNYIIGVQYAIFGPNILVPKTFNILLFALTSVAFRQLGWFISNKSKVAKYSYNLFLLFLPLLFYSATLMREMFMAFLIVFIVYFYFMYVKHKKVKWFFLLLFFSVLMLFTRIEYFIIISFSLLLVFLFSKSISLKKKIWLGVIGSLFFIVSVKSPIAREVGITGSESKISTMHIAGETAEDRVRLREGGITKVFSTVLSNPFRYVSYVFYGVLQYFLDPLPYAWLRLRHISMPQTHFFFSLFNMLHYFLLPGLFWGIYYKYKCRQLTMDEMFILLIVVFNILALALLLRVSVRYSVPIFPLVLLFSAYGWSLKKYRKVYITTIIITAALGFVFFSKFFNISQLIM